MVPYATQFKLKEKTVCSFVVHVHLHHMDVLSKGVAQSLRKVKLPFRFLVVPNIVFDFNRLLA